MIKPNWDIFKAKFSENPQDNFEWYCYLLFCKEFNKPYGIFRYKNQSAIETNPIVIKDEIIGWQAKFYDVGLSNHKDEIIKTLIKSKRDYPKLTKLIFFTNKEWGQYKGKTPKGKIEIEEKSELLDIKLEWRTASYFESEFVSLNSEIISKHFFSLDTSFIDFLNTQKRHTENILRDIQTSITFDNQNIEINRNNILIELKKDSQQVVILSGIGGVGKTAVIKKYYEQLEENIPLYIFKATEFELKNINDLFFNYNFQGFVDAHNNETDKILVIDSSEKLLDLKNTEPFKELLSTLIKYNWRIIFTTRDNYLEDLNFQFFEIYKIFPLNIIIHNLELDELNTISNKYTFFLPKDEKLLELIRIPFYLNEYLKFYKGNGKTKYIDFKNKLWNKIIIKSKPAREQCFFKIAFKRANEGQFFINPNCETQILDDELKKDGILGYESPHGYFITQDIYEEWALEKIIETEFFKKMSNQDFFDKIGYSLPIRRSFRKWVSEKLLLKNSSIKKFIEKVLEDKKIESFWKDEILVSVVLSDYSDNFFKLFKKDLLVDNHRLLKKISFLLRIACKEVDEDFFKQLGFKTLNLFSLKYVLTKPKGQGWKSLIKFVFDNLDEFCGSKIFFIIPVIHDWNSKFKEGVTTRFSSLIALHYYEWIIEEDDYFPRDDTKDPLFQTILNGSSEIKEELENIFQKILENKWKNYRDPYYDLSKVILSKIEGIIVCKTIPAKILQLADLFWSYDHKEDMQYHHSGMEMEQYFGIENNHSDYFPASSYQTPIYWLLQCSLKETIKFILKFTNKSVEHYIKSDLAKNDVEEIEVFIEEGKSIKQYICDRLWCIYRGTQVAPPVLASMHMALEKNLLEIGKNAESGIFEKILLFLLKNSKSASISAIVASIVLAYPDKTFNIATILFKTKDFFLYDKHRLTIGLGHKDSLINLKDSFGINFNTVIHDDERIEACDSEHRKWSLEEQFLKYQCFRTEEISEKESEKRQQVLWDILDEYYNELPVENVETNSDKTWRLFLARMDRRKMSVTTKKVDNGIYIQWNPEIDPELKEFSEQSVKTSTEPMKNSSLKLWAIFKMRNDEKYKQYVQYEKKPKTALKEVKKIIDKLKKITNPKLFKLNRTDAENYYLFNYSIPVQVCSVLIKYYFDKLLKKDIEFCKEIVLQSAYASLQPNYRYQVSDGVPSAISVLPILLEKFPEEKEHIKAFLLLTLFNDYPIDMARTSFNVFSLRAIHKLWENNFHDAQSLLFGYLLLKPKYEELIKKIRKENYKKEINELQKNDVIKKFIDDNEKDLQNMVDNKLCLNNLKDIDKLDLYILQTAFQLIPLRTENKENKKIVTKVISAFANKLFSGDKMDYKVRYEFLVKLAYFVLCSPKEEIKVLLKPFLDNFKSSEAISELFKQFIYAEDSLNSYDNFWEVWTQFNKKVIDSCEKGDIYYYTSNIVKSYLFAQIQWKENTTGWRSLKNENKRFFEKISKKLRNCPSALYAISKLLNDIGSPYLNDGVSWISHMLENNEILFNSKLEASTLYYVENLTRKYIHGNREKIRKSKQLKQNVLVILNFLIEKASVVGYMLRESIL